MEFLIYSFNYDWKSGGNVALHDLGKILSKNYKTYLLANNTISNSDCICINYDQAKTKANYDNVITIYPEVISGNPLNAKNVVRWVLYYPGWHAGAKEYNENEFVVSYDYEFVKNTKYDKSFILTVLDPKLNIFKNSQRERKYNGLLIRKCKNVDYKLNLLNNYKHLLKLPFLKIDDEINKCSNLEELVNVYNTIDLFISFDPHTYHSTIASLCGCTSIVIPSPDLSNVDFYSVIKYGVAYGFENIDFAKLTHDRMIDNLKKIEINTYNKCNDFVKLCKNHFNII